MQQTVVRCTKCKYESITHTQFNTTSLQHKKYLTDCLKDYFLERAIDDYYECEKCKAKSKAKKRHHIMMLPRVMILHIKRFDNNFKKVEKFTSYPDQLEMSEFCSKEVDPSVRGNSKYQLFGVAIHFGTINQGHYYAYVRRDGNWYKFNDEYFAQVRLKEVLDQQAYLLFYRQLDTQ